MFVVLSAVTRGGGCAVIEGHVSDVDESLGVTVSELGPGVMKAPKTLNATYVRQRKIGA